MKTEIGEYMVGAWLKLVNNCDFVDYNVRPPAKGMEGLGEFDVVGLDLKNNKAYLCEVTTHLNGIGYYDFSTTIKKVSEKFNRQKKYASKYLPKNFDVIYMYWSPVVSPKYVEGIKNTNEGLVLVFNSDYSRKIKEIKVVIGNQTKDFGNPFVRVVQILSAMKCYCGSNKKYIRCCGKDK